jgi:hypothetical protein
MTTTTTPPNVESPVAPTGEGNKLNKVLRNIHFLVSALIVGVAFQAWGQSDSSIALGFVLASLSLLLTSFGALYLSAAAQKAVIIISLIVAAAGAYTFVDSMKAAALAGPGIYQTKFDFRAIQYKVSGISDTPCTQADSANPLLVVCDLNVSPLSEDQLPKDDGADATPAADGETESPAAVVARVWGLEDTPEGGSSK